MRKFKDGTVVQEEDRVLPASAPKGTEAATKPQTNDLETTNTSKSNTDNLAGLEYDSDSSSDESDWGGSKERDPILSLLQKEGHQLSGRTSSGGTMISNVQPRHEVTIDSGIGGGGSLYDGQHGVQKKDPNRFFTDIDRRSVAHDETCWMSADDLVSDTSQMALGCVETKCGLAARVEEMLLL